MVYKHFFEGYLHPDYNLKFVVAARTGRMLSKAKMHTRTVVVVVFRFRRVCPCLLFHKVFFLLPSNLLNSSVVVHIFGTIA